MKLSSLTAISPVDGRYRRITGNLAAYFSESALIRYRLLVEVEYFISLCNIPLVQLKDINKNLFEPLRNVYTDFSINDAKEIKDIEKITNHDVKSVEYFLKKKFDELNLSDFKEFIHFGLTSQDINNTAVPYALKDAWMVVLRPCLKKLIDNLTKKARDWIDIPMLARTHGQPASPTRLGKEMYVFVDRLESQIKMLESVPFSAKFGGATGNFNAHVVAYPEIDWVEFGNSFVNNVLGLKRSKVTTQIDHYDNLGAFCDNIKRINTILLDLSKDMWAYISMDYFKQIIVEDEVGSSAMPHKVNPIDFENAEGNFGIANAVFEHLSAKLPVSRLQRDLTDSTVTRNIGVPFSHTLIALNSLIKGLSRLIVNSDAIRSDLAGNWAVVSEAIQTILRREGYPEPYEALKQLTRKNARIDKKAIFNFIESLDVSQRVKKELFAITPENYTGIYDINL